MTTTYRAVVCQTNREEFPMMTNLKVAMISACDRSGRPRGAPMTDHLEPRGYRCPTCKAEPGEPCRSPQARKVEYSHQTRQDVMIRAYNVTASRDDLGTRGRGREISEPLRPAETSPPVHPSPPHRVAILTVTGAPT